MEVFKKSIEVFKKYVHVALGDMQWEQLGQADGWTS